MSMGNIFRASNQKSNRNLKPSASASQCNCCYSELGVTMQTTVALKTAATLSQRLEIVVCTDCTLH